MDSPAHTNRLAQETSPYLLQHAHNPVDWHPWGPEAFAAAQAQNKPIFLSVGYSACYWCHVMERQCFENEAIAAEMNQRFINIKVDREERPDVDQLYMNAVQVLTRQGGWPMSVFLLPDLRPFYGGTYFPPTDGYGKPGFPRLLAAIEDAYRSRRGDVEKSADQLVTVLGRMAEPPRPASPFMIDEAFIDALVARSVSDYDPDDGGFGSAPKFPRETLLELLLVHQRHGPLHARMKMLRHTLDAMARGGIRDHLGGGFHRYSTDAQWLVPHFEIMLYDNALLAWCYVEAYAQTSEERYAVIARGILEFVLREMTSPQGAFYTAFDAEVDGQEGEPYLWTPDQIQDVLGDGAALFNKVYGVDLGPNFADPHHGSGTPEKNILHLPEPMQTVAARLKMSEVELDAKLKPMRQALYTARRQRKQPMLDTKILTSWNGLMIRALAHAGKVLGEGRYMDAAGKATDFLLAAHANPAGGLYRTSRDGKAKYAAFLDDYAFLAQALLALNDATRRQQAEALANVLEQKFLDASGGGFYFTAAGAEDLIVRQKTAGDSPLPSGSAVAAMVMLELGRTDVALDAIALFAAQLQSMGEGMSAMIQAALHGVQQHGPLHVDAATEVQNRPLSPRQSAQNVVTLSAVFSQANVLEVKVAILNGFHINAHEAGDGLIATRLSVGGGAAAMVACIEYPPGEELSVAFSPQPIRVYSGEITIGVRFHDRVQTPVTVSLHYQACDESACLPPVTKTLDVQ